MKINHRPNSIGLRALDAGTCTLWESVQFALSASEASILR